MKFVSFNVNSVRLRTHQIQKVIDQHQPDFIGLQETKVTDDDFPIEQIRSLGYEVEFFGQKTHYGVALMSRLPFKRVYKGFSYDIPDAQRRFIGGEFSLENGSTLHVFNGYFPQGESRDHPVKFPNKRNYYQNLNRFLQENFQPQDALVVMGDMNISHTDLDIGIGEENRKRWLRTGKCSFLPEEREWLDQLLSWGLVDTFRQHHPQEDNLFSWFDYRSKGFERDPKRGLRIDLILGSQGIAQQCVSAGIDYDVRAMPKPSDHCPVWAEFNFENTSPR